MFRIIMMTVMVFGMAALAEESKLTYKDINFTDALKAQHYPLALFDEMNATGNIACVDVFSKSVKLDESCLSKNSFLSLFVATESLEQAQIEKKQAMVKAYFDPECSTRCFSWVKEGDEGRLTMDADQSSAYTEYREKSAKAEVLTAASEHVDDHNYCATDKAMATVQRLRAKRGEPWGASIDSRLSDGEEWQLYRSENCLRLNATDIFTTYVERKQNIKKGIFQGGALNEQKELLEQEQVVLQNYSDNNISIRLPKDQRFFQDLYDYNNWFVKVYAGYEFLGAENLLKQGTGRFGLSVYRQMELDPSETISGIWRGFHLTRLHLFFDLAVSGLLLTEHQTDATGNDINITEVAQTGVGRIGAFWPFFRNDSGVDGSRYFFDFGLVGTYSLLSVEHAGYSFYKDDVNGTRLNRMYTYGLRIASSPEMYAEYKWGRIGDYDIQVLRGQFPAYTLTQNASFILGAEMLDFAEDANKAGIDDQVKFYVLWRYDLSWMDTKSQ